MFIDRVLLRKPVFLYTCLLRGRWVDFFGGRQRGLPIYIVLLVLWLRFKRPRGSVIGAGLLCTLPSIRMIPLRFSYFLAFIRPERRLVLGCELRCICLRLDTGRLGCELRCFCLRLDTGLDRHGLDRKWALQAGERPR